MIEKGYYLHTKNWSYPDILIDYFLSDIEEELTRDIIERNLKCLKIYRLKLENDPLNLSLGDYTLEIQGVDEATATIRGLDFVLDKYNGERG